MTDPGAERDDPLRSMRVERVERDDGRYLIYFSWPEEAVPDAAEARPGVAREEAGSREGTGA